jgi:ketosteroid isomerase-like protein
MILLSTVGGAVAADVNRLNRLADHMMSTWTGQDVEQVLDCYTDDLIYVDPNTRGPVVGRDAMRAYLTKLFSRWTMTWHAGEIFPLEGTDGVTIAWDATLATPGSDRSVVISGLDLVILDGDRVKRNEVFFDRSALVALLRPASA